MVPFDLELEIENKSLTISAEQLERFADVDGYTRYAITAGDRRSVVYVNIESEQPLAYDNQDLFSAAELTAIAAAIRQYNRENQVVFAQFLLDF
ncbi:MAG TPA: hypothetical protein VK668_07050 [Mucilaginibacter sp.]|nr:hypothetical protein [Mucilaginibacter sp.]